MVWFYNKGIVFLAGTVVAMGYDASGSLEFWLANQLHWGTRLVEILGNVGKGNWLNFCDHGGRSVRR